MLCTAFFWFLKGWLGRQFFFPKLLGNLLNSLSEELVLMKDTHEVFCAKQLQQKKFNYFEKHVELGSIDMIFFTNLV